MRPSATPWPAALEPVFCPCQVGVLVERLGMPGPKPPPGRQRAWPRRAREGHVFRGHPHAGVSGRRTAESSVPLRATKATLAAIVLFVATQRVASAPSTERVLGHRHLHVLEGSPATALPCHLCRRRSMVRIDDGSFLVGRASLAAARLVREWAEVSRVDLQPWERAQVPDTLVPLDPLQ